MFRAASLAAERCPTPHTSDTGANRSNFSWRIGSVRSSTPPVAFHFFAAQFASLAKVLVVLMPTPTGIPISWATRLECRVPGAARPQKTLNELHERAHLLSAGVVRLFGRAGETEKHTESSHNVLGSQHYYGDRSVPGQSGLLRGPTSPTLPAFSAPWSAKVLSAGQALGQPDEQGCRPQCQQ